MSSLSLQNMEIQRHTIHTKISLHSFMHKNTHMIKAYFVFHGVAIVWSASVCAHARMAVVHANPHVVSSSWQRPICLNFHRTAAGSRSVRAHGDSNASPSGCKKQVRYLDVCHVTPQPQDQGWKNEVVPHTLVKLHFLYFETECRKAEWWLCLQSF